MTLAVLGVAAGVGGVMLPSAGISWPAFGPGVAETPLTGGVSHPAAQARTLSAAPPAAREAGAVRRIYRHSVIPGGVADKVELANILRTDLVVAAHYAGFDVGNARAVTVTAPRAVYVSYRKGDQIFWTAKKVMLEQGETLLTDGEHDIRARCANRISDVPQYPVEKHGPSEAELDTVVAGNGAGAAGDEAGGMLAVAADTADLGLDEAVGQRYFTTSFPNGAGLVMLADASSAQARQSGQAPGMPDWYNAPVGYGGVLGAGSRSGSSGSAPAGGDGDTSTATPGSTVVPPAAGSPASEGSGETGGTGGAGGNTGTTPVATPDGSGGSGSGSTGGSGGTGGTGSGGTGSGGSTGGGTGGDTGGGATEPPGSTTPSLPTPAPTPDAGADTPVITPGTPVTPVTPATPGDIIVDPAAPADVPEPGTLWLGGLALAAMLWLRRKGARAR